MRVIQVIQSTWYICTDFQFYNKLSSYCTICEYRLFMFLLLPVYEKTTTEVCMPDIKEIPKVPVLPSLV